MADFDAADGYRIRLDEVGDVLRFSSGFCDEEEDELDEEADYEETHAVAASAVEAAEEVMFLSQGSYTPSDEEHEGVNPYRHCTPPFLVSRRLLATLKAGESASLTIHGEAADLENDGTETVTLKIDGEEREAQALRARDDEQGMIVRVLDDEAWPLLLSAEFQGDNYIRLVAIHTPG